MSMLYLISERREDVGIFPFLHPSYGQCQVDTLTRSGGDNGGVMDMSCVVLCACDACQMNLRTSPDWSRWEDRIEVLLKPGELLYIPPFWIHEVWAALLLAAQSLLKSSRLH
jgi:hypothetical protein